MKIVLAQQIDGNEDIVDIAEDERALLCVPGLLLHERRGVVSPVAAGIQVVRGVVTVVEGEAVALDKVSRLVAGDSG